MVRQKIVETQVQSHVEWSVRKRGPTVESGPRRTPGTLLLRTATTSHGNPSWERPPVLTLTTSALETPFHTYTTPRRRPLLLFGKSGCGSGNVWRRFVQDSRPRPSSITFPRCERRELRPWGSQIGQEGHSTP